MKSALLLIDLQNDFCPSGALAVAQGEQTIDIANQAMAFCQQHPDIAIIASQDWHPANHRSFAVNSQASIGTLGELDGLPQVWWPVHCVQGEAGADFHPDLNVQAIEYVVRKGQNPDIDSYSAFFDNGKRAATPLHSWLTAHHISKLAIMGLATDYCVKFTVLDALTLGYQVTLLTEGCRGVNLNEHDSELAIAEMQAAGATISTLAHWYEYVTA
jgi:nicotinamidase/pyrazinamidase